MELIRSILDAIFGWLRSGRAGGGAGGATALPLPITRRVLMVVHDPYVAGSAGPTLREAKGWHDPDELAREYIAEVQKCSFGYANYQIVERLITHEFPRKADGFRYDAAGYLAASQPQDFHSPDLVDYLALVRQFGMVERVRSGAVDEIWLFGFPYAGYHESVMAGPGAFQCNSEPLSGLEAAGRRFVIMGFSMETGVGEMLEDLGHRAEAIVGRVFAGTMGDANLWERFTRYDLRNPGQAECGTVHYPPNGRQDYDWNNPAYVPSRCDNWLHFPDLSGEPRPVNASEWGGNIRGKHTWWFTHFPHMTGETGGISGNWWEYVIDPNTVP